MMLSARALNSGYGQISILRDVSFDVAEREFVGILGHNGAGKTTLLRTLAGFNPIKSGQLLLSGADITAAPTHRRAAAGIGYVPQGRQIFPSLSVRENLTIATARSKRPIDEALAHFPRLTRLLDRPGGALSGGEQQLLALARCFSARPAIMLLDEPTEGIQPSIIEEMVETLKTLNRQGLTVVLVEQNLEFLAHLASRILIIKRGQVGQEIASDVAKDVSALAKLLTH